MMLRLFLMGWLLALLAMPAVAGQAEVDAILAQEKPPFGVVFEIVEGDTKALDWAILQVKHEIQRLRARFPDISLAVVSHGREQFALLTERQGANQAVHEAVESLAKSDVPVHVCGTHARWRGKGETDFPDYVDVTPAGPTEIRNYQAMDYRLVRIRKP